jgi:iron complex outermembrane receptor protein
VLTGGKAAICLRAASLGLLMHPSGLAFAQSEPAESSGSKTEDVSELEELVVTGSHIRGTEAAGSKLIVISREQIDASGYGRVEDVLATVTQNVNRANAAVGGGEQVDNSNRGAEVQLRGLGVGTTLTLVNGQRQGASGSQGTFTDVSSIPVSAIDRIEILPEGAAALYGSDAIGGVVNIILRKNFEGIEARVRGSSTDSDASERSAALLLGHVGSRGNVLAGFQFNDSDALPCSARAYCAANGDFRSLGGIDLRGFGGNPGTILDPHTLAPIAAIPHGQDGTQLTAAQLIPGAANYTNSVIDNDILPKQSMRSAFASASYHLTDKWELSADGHYSSRSFKSTYPQPTGDFLVPASNAFNHLGGPVNVAYDFTPDFGPVVDSGPTEMSFGSAALKGVLPHGWQVNLAAAYAKASTDFVESNVLNYDAIDAALNRSDPATALNIFGDGSHTNPTALAALRNQNTVSDALNVFTTVSANVIADGPLFKGRAGDVRLAVGGEFRHEHSTGLNIADGPENRARLVRSGFFELAVPIVGPPAAASTDRLDLSLAGRYDSYSDAGSTFNPKVGFSWQPFALAKIRGNWGTAFRAPPFFWSNRDELGDTAIASVVDPRSSTGYSRALELFGPQPDLQPETARSWTVGVDLTPPAIQHLLLSLTYFDIDYQGKIHNPGPYAAIFLTQEAQYASLITRNPTQAQIAAVCNKPPLSGGECNQPIAAILDNRFRNLASLTTRGVDATLDYFRDTAWGKVRSSLNGTYTIDQKQQITPAAPVFDLVDTVGNPLSLRLVENLSWSLRGWTAQTTVNYTGAYRDPGSIPARRVDSWTTVDVNVGYQFDGGSGWRANTHTNLGIINVFDQRPPFVNQFDLTSGTLGYDAANATLLGRGVSLQVVKRWGL